MSSSDASRRRALIISAAALGTLWTLALCSIYYRRRRNRIPTFGKYQYPATRTVDHKDKYHGEDVADPYRWLEDTNSKEVQAWVQAQRACTSAYMDATLEPARSAFASRMESMLDYDKYSCPSRHGDRYFFYKKAGLQNHPVLYKQDLKGEPEVLLDPNAIREDGTASIQNLFFSKDGSRLAYTMSLRDADSSVIYAINVADGVHFEDKIDWCRHTSVAWNKDGTGFFYSGYPIPESTEGTESTGASGPATESLEGNMLFYHHLGTPQSEDTVIYNPEEGKGKWMLGCDATDDYDTLLITIHVSCDPVNRLYYMDISLFNGTDLNTLGPLVKLVDNFEASYQYITNEGRTFWFFTNLEARKHKVINMKLPPVGSPMETDPKALAALPKVEVVAQESAVLEGAYAVAGDRLVLVYMRDACEQLELCDLAGQNRRSIPLPPLGSIEGISANKLHDELFFKFVSFQHTGSIYKAVIKHPEEGGKSKVEVDVKLFRSVEVPGLDPNEFHTNQVHCKSIDGTAIPLFIIQQKGQRGLAPCLLYGYGGFNIPVRPHFNVNWLIFIKHFGGRVCVANIRGGGEFGEDWHKAGCLQNKQNVFDDFTSAAKYLCTLNLTSPAQLAISGASNGGLLVGACINQNPELFACAVAQVGVMDMLRFHKFTIGYAWCSDYGNPDESEEDYKVLKSYSPLHNVSPTAGQYPAVLLCTGDHDDRVVPCHTYKYAATLQNVIGSRPGEPHPLLIRVEIDAGHAGRKSTTKTIKESSEIWSFIAKHTGAVWKP